MKSWMNAALVAALAAFAACTVDTRARERFESSRGAPAPSDELTPDAGSDGAASESECVLHSDCEEGLACVDGTCSAIATDGSVDAPEPDANESESESEAEAEAEAESESESEAEAEAESEAEAEAEADAALPSADGASVPDGGSSTDGGAPSADATAAAPDAALPPEPVTVVIVEVPEGQTVDTTARFCSTLGGGWACAPFALGGTSGREIRATFEDPAPTAHVFNACLRNCDDPFTGAWLAYQSSGLRQLADPVVTRGSTVVPESLTDNGVGGANWLVDLSPPSAE